MSACRWRCGRSTPGFDVVGIDVDEPGQAARPPATPSSRTSPTLSVRAALDAGATAPTADRAELDGFDVAVITVPTPLREGAPDLSLHRAGARTSGRATCGRAHGGAGVHDLPGHDRGAVRRRSSRRAPGSAPGDDFHRRLQPRADRPGQPDWTFVEHARRWSPASTPASLDGSRPSTRASSTTTVPVVGDPGGRAGQAAGEHLPARQHRAGERAGDVRPTTSTSTSGRPSTPPPPSRSGSCGSPRARASAATACRSTRRYLSWRVQRSLGQRVPLRRAGQRHQRPHARLRRRAGSTARLERAAQVGQRQPRPAARPGLQEELRRRPGVAGDRGRPAAARPGAPTSRVADPHVDRGRRARGVGRVVDSTPTRSTRPTWSCAHRPRRLRLRPRLPDAGYVFDTLPVRGPAWGRCDGRPTPAQRLTPDVPDVGVHHPGPQHRALPRPVSGVGRPPDHQPSTGWRSW